MAIIYLVRHGQASFGAADYDQLSELGAEQCRLLGTWFGQCGFAVDQIITGGLKRHLQSADAFTSTLPEPQRPKTAPVIDTGFDEFNHREMLSRFNPEFTDLDAVKRYLTDNDQDTSGFAPLFSQAFARWIGGKFDGDYMEPWPQFSLRCNAAVDRISDNYHGQSVVVFTSGGAISAIAQKLLDFPDAQVAKINLMLQNSGVTRLSACRNNASLNTLNSCAHLDMHQRDDLMSRL